MEIQTERSLRERQHPIEDIASAQPIGDKSEELTGAIFAGPPCEDMLSKHIAEDGIKTERNLRERQHN